MTVGKKNPFCQKAIIAIEIPVERRYRFLVAMADEIIQRKTVNVSNIERVNHTQGEHRKSKTIVKMVFID